MAILHGVNLHGENAHRENLRGCAPGRPSEAVHTFLRSAAEAVTTRLPDHRIITATNSPEGMLSRSGGMTM
jgi:hypothetical protein